MKAVKSQLGLRAFGTKVLNESSNFLKGMAMNRKGILRPIAIFTCALTFITPDAAFAWGDDGHQVVALIAWNYMTPTARSKVLAILDSDNEPFKMHDGGNTNDSFATQATWADYYRTSTGQHGPAYQKTHNWHFVDIEINGGTLEAACPNYLALTQESTAFDGSADDCVVNKIKQFTAELIDQNTVKQERLRALKMVMHFVGDVHQPLHASDDHDAGGNSKKVSFSGMKSGNLHGYWDTEFVHLIDATPKNIADKLTANITPTEVKQWSQSDPAIWANESYALAKKVGYGELPDPVQGRGKSTSYHLDQDYVNDAQEVVEMQLSKAGVRLAALLNTAFQ